MKKQQKRSILAAAAMIAAVGGIGTTLAYFTDTDQKVNVFTMGELALGLQEPEWDPTPDGGSGDGQNMYPGYTVYKNPTIKNISSGKHGPSPCYARIRMTVEDQAGQTIEEPEILELVYQMIYFDATYSGTYDKKGQAEKLIEGRVPGYSLRELSGYPMINPVFVKDQKRSGDSSLVFNYVGTEQDGILQIGEEAVLFTNLVVPTEWTQTELSLVGDVKLDIEAECIQCSGFSSQEEAFAALDQEVAKEEATDTGQENFEETKGNTDRSGGIG